MNKRVIYSGTFDPITNGHSDLVERALLLFDEIIIAVSKGFEKEPFFTKSERVLMAKEMYKDNPRVSVVPFNGLLVDFFDKVKADAVLRGLRAVSDFEYEFQMAAINRQLNSKVETIFLTPSEKYSCLSSTMIRQVALIDHTRIKDLVHPIVFDALSNKFKK